jgi:uncharacterized protein YgbK (DUF1537 family)
MRVAIIADDLTGAMDTAAPFAARGFATRVFPEPDPDPAALAAEVAAVNTESRHLAADRAASLVAACTRRLAAAEILFKKIDSTLRGNVAAEVAAALEASGREAAIVTPAMPSQGRVLRGGRLYVHGEPLAESAIGRDALSPPPRKALIELLREAAPGRSWRAARPDSDLPARTGAVFDAESAADMIAVARRVVASGGRVLACGSGGLGHALAELLGRGHRAAPIESTAGPLLYVVGSRTPQARAQVAALAAAGGDVEVIEVFDDSACGLRSTPVVVLRPGPREGDPAAVSAQLAEAAARAVDALAPAAIVMTGGDTALAVLRRLGAGAVDVADEILPGIALGWIRVGGGPVAVVTKAGGFGDPQVFVTLRDRLAAKGF